MEKYIKREDLGEAMEAIARCAIENAENVRTEMKVAKNWNGNVQLDVIVRDCETFKSLAEAAYVIVDDVKPAEYGDVMIAALDAKAAAEAALEQEVEPKAEEE